MGSGENSSAGILEAGSGQGIQSQKLYGGASVSRRELGMDRGPNQGQMPVCGPQVSPRQKVA